MITWLNNLIQRRGRIVFVFLLVVIVIAFVFTVGNTPGIVSGQNSTSRATFFGYDLNNPNDVEKLSREAWVSFVLQNGQPPFNDEAINRQIEIRTAAIALAADLGIGRPSPDGLRAYIEALPPFQTVEGTFDSERYAITLDYLKANPRISDDTIAATLVGDWRMDQVLDTFATLDPSLPVEATRAANWRDSTWTLAIATLDFESFQPEIEVTEEALDAFYANTAERYATPSKLAIAFVRFEPSAFANAVEPPDEETLFTYFLENSSRLGFTAPSVDDTLIPQSDANPLAPQKAFFETNKEAILADYRENEAFPLAAEAAQDFAIQLYDRNIGYASDAFNSLIAEKGLELNVLDPVAPEGFNPDELPLAATTVRAAFEIPLQRYYSDPVDDRDSVVVLFRHEEIASRIPERSEVAATVEKDFLLSEKRDAFFEKGETVREALISALAEGQPFVDAAEAAGLSVEIHPDVRLTEPTPAIPSIALQQLAQYSDDPVSRMLRHGENGIFAHVVERIGPGADQFDAARAELAETFSTVRSREITSTVLEEWMRRGIVSNR